MLVDVEVHCHSSLRVGWWVVCDKSVIRLIAILLIDCYSID
jgi:hypothetical protein